jgi:dienelactone hydrolase
LATAEVVAGLLVTAAGAALGFAYLRTAGWSRRGVAGLLAFAGGMALLVTGTATIVRSLTGRRRWLAFPVGAALIYGLGFPTVLAVAATNVPRSGLGSETPAKSGLTFTDVTFQAADGVPLSGWYLPSSNRAAVVMVPGASSTRSSVLRPAVVLARHGYGVLLFDPRGQGRSGGRAMNFGWYGERDVAAALDWLATRSNVDPGRIGGLGESMGGEEMIGTLAADTRLRAVVAEGATNRVAGDWAWLSDAYGLRGSVQEAVHRVTYLLTDLLTDAGPPITLRAAVEAAAPRSVLLVAAGDVPDEGRAGESIRGGSPQTVELWIVPGAGHTDGLRTQPAEWERRVVDFFDKALVMNTTNLHQEVP